MYIIIYIFEAFFMVNKNQFIKPVAEIIVFQYNDIITYSVNGQGDNNWSNYPGAEDWNND